LLDLSRFHPLVFSFIIRGGDNASRNER
jgi:hypothetical protein